MMLPNGLQYTREWMNKIIGDEMVRTMFQFADKYNELQLTHEEHALVFPVVICVKGACACAPAGILLCSHVRHCLAADETLQDQETIRSIQYCYLYALYIQMLTTRAQSQAKAIFRSFLKVGASRCVSSFTRVNFSRADFRLSTSAE